MIDTLIGCLTTQKDYKAFDLNHAIICAVLSNYVYETDKKQKQLFIAFGFENITVVSKKNTHVTLATYNADLYVIFAGTNFADNEDLLDNLKLVWANEGAGEVHEGYKKHLDAVWQDISNYVNTHDHTNLIVTGHSMGAACGQIANYRLPWSIGYYFGSPRVVDKKIEKDIFANIYNIRNRFDIVSELPPGAFGFKLCGEIYTLNPDVLVKKLPKLCDFFRSIFYTILFYVTKIWSKIFGSKNHFQNLIVMNHGIEIYCDKLIKLSSTSGNTIN